MSYFNRKERTLKINKKAGGRFIDKRINWRQRHKEKSEADWVDELRNNYENEAVDDNQQHKSVGSGNKDWYTVSIALPGSIMNNILKENLAAYVCGEIARTCAIFCVEEIIIFDDTATMTQKDLDEYNSGNWSGDWTSENKIESNFFLARHLEYMECPQYLRKALFPLDNILRFAGIMNPLNALHHLRANELEIPYREGVVLDKCIKNGGSWCDIGLSKFLQLQPTEILPSGTRVTIKITSGLDDDQKRLKGTLTSAKSIRKEMGVYWGYNVRIEKKISNVFSKEYDYVIGTSEHGKFINEIPFVFKEDSNVLIVFGGLDGLEGAFKADPEISAKDPAKYFKYYLNSLPNQGSRVIRTEEAIPITLTAVKCKLNEMIT